MAIKLNEMQSALLGAAAQRGDKIILLPEGRRLAAARKAVDALLATGLAREVRARGDAPVWRRDKDGERTFALKLTASGMKAVAGGANDHNSDPQDQAAGSSEMASEKKTERQSRRVAIAKEKEPSLRRSPRPARGRRSIMSSR